MAEKRTAPLSEGVPTNKDYGLIQVKGSDNSAEKQIFKQDYPANFDPKALIGGDLEKASRMQTEIPEKVGMFTIMTANRTIQDAKLRPDPAPLWMTLWYEGEVCCLFSDSNLGKSIYATQIAADIAQKQKVLYFDFELSDKQFQLRYTDEQGKQNAELRS